MISFQSTLPRRERQNHPHNIHRIKYNFNPRSREGSDLKILHWYTAQAHFNPRSREGSDKIDGLIDDNATDFNPRSREGSDGEKYEKIFNI